MNASTVARRLDGLLIPAGFTRRKVRWTRHAQRYVDVVDLQSAKSGDSLTVNVGVVDLTIYRRIWGEEIPAALASADATVSRRLGLLAAGHDESWSLHDSDAVSAMESLAREHLLPFVDSLHSPTAMEEALEQIRGTYPPPLIALALLRYERGDRGGACAALSVPLAQVSAWTAKLEQLAAELGCA